jgi:hypothetical protein
MSENPFTARKSPCPTRNRGIGLQLNGGGISADEIRCRGQQISQSPLLPTNREESWITGRIERYSKSRRSKVDE